MCIDCEIQKFRILFLFCSSFFLLAHIPLQISTSFTIYCLNVILLNRLISHEVDICNVLQADVKIFSNSFSNGFRLSVCLIRACFSFSFTFSTLFLFFFSFSLCIKYSNMDCVDFWSHVRNVYRMYSVLTLVSYFANRKWHEMNEHWKLKAMEWAKRKTFREITTTQCHFIFSITFTE